MKSVFTIEGPPVPKQRPRMSYRGGMYTPARTRSYESHCARVAAVSALALRSKRDAFAESRIAATLEVYFPTLHRRDVDNVAKSVLDGIVKGGLIKDDSQVDELTVRRHLDRERPRVEVTLEALNDS